MVTKKDINDAERSALSAHADVEAAEQHADEAREAYREASREVSRLEAEYTLEHPADD